MIRKIRIIPDQVSHPLDTGIDLKGYASLHPLPTRPKSPLHTPLVVLFACCSARAWLPLRPSQVLGILLHGAWRVACGLLDMPVAAPLTPHHIRNTTPAKFKLEAFTKDITKAKPKIQKFSTLEYDDNHTVALPAVCWFSCNLRTTSRTMHTSTFTPCATHRIFSSIPCGAATCANLA